MSTVVGHKHSVCGVRYHTNHTGKTTFGVDTGCGVDKDSYAMRYAKDMPNKPVLACAVIIDGKEAHIVKMDTDINYMLML